jgi:hypothetical protein
MELEISALKQASLPSFELEGHPDISVFRF